MAQDSTRRALARARKRIAEIERIDFFSAGGRDTAEGAMRRLVARTTNRLEDREKGEKKMAAVALQDLGGRVWVTRRGVRVDRIASAWLIRRWIDADARFKFIPGKEYAPTRGEIVHDIDLKDAKFGRAQTEGIAHVLAGIVAGTDDDDRRIERGSALFEDLYRFFSTSQA